MNLCTSDDKNVYGQKLECCSKDPLTGYYRDGYCKTDEMDFGSHTVCAGVTLEWLQHQKSKGNDLMTPRGGFPGLKPGDNWCLCASRWRQGLQEGHATKVKMSATNMKALQTVGMDQLESNACNSDENLNEF